MHLAAERTRPENTVEGLPQKRSRASASSSEGPSATR